MPARRRPTSRSRSRSRRPRAVFGGGPLLVTSVLVVAAAAALWWFLRSNDNPPCCEPCPSGPGQVDIAYGARQNSPQPSLPDEVLAVMRTAANAERPIVVYRVDGDPTEAIRQQFQSSTRATGPRGQEIDGFMADLTAAMAGIRPVRPEAAPLAALTLAARDTHPGDTVVFVDSGLQTVAPLNFLTPGLMLAEPPDVVADLAAAHAIPDLNGRRVIFLYLGDAIAPQADLGGTRQDNVKAIWQAIANAGHAACVDTLTYPPQDERPLSGAASVTPVPIPQPVAPPRCGETVLYNGEDVGFEPDSDQFRHRDAAADFLRPYAKTIVNEGSHVRLIGTTARWGSADGQRRLGLRRAEAVKQLLKDLGVNPQRVTTEGVGSYSTYYHPDNGPNGPLRPGPAALNRSVILNILCDRV